METSGKTSLGDTGANKLVSAQDRIAEQNARNKAAQQDRIAAAAAAAPGATLGGPGNVRSEPTNVRSAATNVRSAPIDVRTGQPAPSANTNALLSAAQALQAPQSPSAPATPAPVVNAAAANPDVAFALNEQKKRYAGDNGAQTAVDLATSNARDLGTGLMREAGASRSARGVSGTGIDRFDTGRILGNVQKESARATTQIGLDRENMKDQTLRDITGGGTAQASIMRGQQDVAQRQWEAQEQIRQRGEDAVNARQTQLINLMMQLAA